MRTHIIAATAVVTLGSTAAAYDVLPVSIVPDAVLQPSSGNFITQLAAPGQEGLYLTASNVLVTTARPDWRDSRDAIMTSTWFTMDPYGPNGFDGGATYGTGWARAAFGLPPGSPPVNVPMYEHVLSTPDSGLAINGNNGDPVNGDGLSPGFAGGIAGFQWGAGIDFSFRAAAEDSVVNGEFVESMYLGHFVLSDPTAHLVGDDMLFRVEFNGIDSELFLLPLDGTQVSIDFDGDERSFRLEYERTTFTNSLGTFTALDMYLVPTPASTIPLLALLPALRRRRATQ